VEHALLEAPAGQFGKEALDGIGPGGRSRREVEGPARVLGEPFAHLGVFVGGVVVGDGVDRLSFWHLRLNGIESDKLLMAVALHVVADDGAVEDIEGGKQGRGAVAFVVVRHRAGAACLHWQAWLGSIERLDLALLIDGEDNRVGRRIDIETDNVLELLGKLRIVRKFERPDAMRRELVGLKDALHRPQTDARRLGQHATGPMGCFSRRRPQCQVDHTPHRIRRQRRLTGFARLVARKSVAALCHEPRLPPPHHRLRLAGSSHELSRPAPVGGGKDDFGALDMFLRSAAIEDDRLKTTAIFPCDVHRYSCSHNESLDCFGRFGNRPNEPDH
jgi:hypothetical protein